MLTRERINSIKEYLPNKKGYCIECFNELQVCIELFINSHLEAFDLIDTLKAELNNNICTMDKAEAEILKLKTQLEEAECFIRSMKDRQDYDYSKGYNKGFIEGGQKYLDQIVKEKMLNIEPKIILKASKTTAKSNIIYQKITQRCRACKGTGMITEEITVKKEGK